MVNWVFLIELSSNKRQLFWSTRYVINFAYKELDIGDNVVFQMDMNRKKRQMLRMQMVKPGH